MKTSDYLIIFGPLYLLGLFFGNAVAEYLDLEWKNDFEDSTKSSYERFIAFLKGFVLLPIIGVIVAIAFYFMILKPLGAMLGWMPD